MVVVEPGTFQHYSEREISDREEVRNEELAGLHGSRANDVSELRDIHSGGSHCSERFIAKELRRDAIVLDD